MIVRICDRSADPIPIRRLLHLNAVLIHDLAHRLQQIRLQRIGRPVPFKLEDLIQRWCDHIDALLIADDLLFLVQILICQRHTEIILFLFLEILYTECIALDVLAFGDLHVPFQQIARQASGRFPKLLIERLISKDQKDGRNEDDSHGSDHNCFLFHFRLPFFHPNVCMTTSDHAYPGNRFIQCHWEMP